MCQIKQHDFMASHDTESDLYGNYWQLYTFMQYQQKWERFQII